MTVSTADIQLITLVNGQVMDEFLVAPQDSLYFKFKIWRNESIRIGVSNGEFEIVVSKSESDYSFLYENHMSVLDLLPGYKYDNTTVWSLQASQDLFNNHLIISKDDPQHCSYCVYWIGVKNVATES